MNKIETLSKISLFWDVDMEKLDPEKHKEFIIRRILERGDLDDLRWAKKKYGKKDLENTFCRFKNKLDKKSSNFWPLYFNLNKTLCTPKPLIQKLSAFFTK